MKRIDRKFLLIVSIIVIASFLMQAYAFAQLLLVEQKYKVTKVDVGKSRLEATGLAKDSQGVGYILVDGNTKVYHDNKEVLWTSIKVGTIITVKGGVNWDMKVKAKEIRF